MGVDHILDEKFECPHIFGCTPSSKSLPCLIQNWIRYGSKKWFKVMSSDLMMWSKNRIRLDRLLMGNSEITKLFPRVNHLMLSMLSRIRLSMIRTSTSTNKYNTCQMTKQSQLLKNFNKKIKALLMIIVSLKASLNTKTAQERSIGQVKAQTEESLLCQKWTRI